MNDRDVILRLLGYDESGEGLTTKSTDGKGNEINIDNDPAGELECVIEDLEKQGADPVCIRTIRRIMDRLDAVSKFARGESVIVG